MLMLVSFQFQTQRSKLINGLQIFWKERAAFSFSTAVLITLACEDPNKVRGVLGQLIHRILQ